MPTTINCLPFVQGINSFFIVLQVVFGGVGAIALLVAAIGIANTMAMATMAMAILERTREIGLMKAIGATNCEVLSVFLGEAAGIGFLDGWGGALGWGVRKLLNVCVNNECASGGCEVNYEKSRLSSCDRARVALLQLIQV